MRFAVVIVAALVLAGSAQAVTPERWRCFDLTGRSAPSFGTIVNDLQLSRDMEKALRARLSSYGSLRGFAGLKGIGLTPEQIVDVERRIAIEAKANTWPLGWPCKPFKNRSKVLAFVKSELVANGFRPRMTVVSLAARQIQIDAIQDGYRYIVVVVRTGPREIVISAKPVPSGPGGGSAKYRLPFDA